ncbi:hypothetical protein NY78_2713 [Desulfovibrio sp. TomC]|nr:hypothetical protein NY78_2713 [Desulfovibrio sp. TomC]
MFLKKTFDYTSGIWVIALLLEIKPHFLFFYDKTKIKWLMIFFSKIQRNITIKLALSSY